MSSLPEDVRPEVHGRKSDRPSALYRRRAMEPGRAPRTLEPLRGATSSQKTRTLESDAESMDNLVKVEHADCNPPVESPAELRLRRQCIAAGPTLWPTTRWGSRLRLGWQRLCFGKSSRDSRASMPAATATALDLGHQEDDGHHQKHGERETLDHVEIGQHR